jgi:hypothetical protein
MALGQHVVQHSMLRETGPARRSTGDGRIFAERVQCRMWGYNNRSTRLVMNGYVMVIIWLYHGSRYSKIISMMVI